MKPTYHNIILFFLAITKVHQIQSSNIFLIGTALISLGCNSFSGQLESELHFNNPQQITQIKDSLILNKNEGLVYYKSTLFTGKEITKHPNDTIASCTMYHNGKRNGYSKKWFLSGQLSYEGMYKDGKLHGKQFSWWDNGNLRSTSNFVAGVPEGKQVQYYRNGAKFKQLNLAHGKEEGLQQSWRKNGKIYNNYEAKNGRIFGLKRSKLCFKLDNEKITN